LLLDKKALSLRNPANKPFELTIGIYGFQKTHAIDTGDIALNLADRCAQKRGAECDFNPGRSFVTYRSDFARISIKHGRDD